MIDFKQYGIEMWDNETIRDFRATLLDWYDKNKRDLPWRQTQDPYAIWVSEIMLQQTQVATVIPYYQRFLDWFPTISSLAHAPEEKLLKAWEGLGYYSRVRNMQHAAQQMLSDFQGDFPSNYVDILSLKGIGPYTAGAISSIAFNQAEPAIDGNVMRVMARLFEIDYDIGLPKNRPIFQAIVQVLIDPDRPGDFNQALMDLGSDIESAKNPRPEDSPIKAFNAAYQHGTYDRYPLKEPKKKPKPVHIQAFIIQNQDGKFLLEKKTTNRLLAGFWTFPLLEVKSQKDDKADKYLSSFEEYYQLKVQWSDDKLPTITHTFSHQKWTINSSFGRCDQTTSLTKDKKRKWVSPEDFSNYPFATPQKKLWQNFKNSSLL